MKTRYNRAPLVTNQIPRLAAAMAMRTQTLQPVNISLTSLLIVLFSTFATTAVFGQVTYTWTNALGGDIAASTNWNPNGQPSGASIDTAQWDGQTSGPL